MTTSPGRSDRDQEQAFLSRALAALVVRDLTGCASDAAAAAVIDGQDDVGIDAVAVDRSGSHLWLIQSKWSDTGRAGFGVADALKFLEGLRHIDARRFHRFNAKFQQLVDQVVAVLSNPRARITMVCALMHTEPLSDEVTRRLTDGQQEFNQLGSMLDHHVYLAPDIWQVVRRDLAEPPIPLTAKMDDWIKFTEPYEAFHGVVSVDEVAQWYETHGDRLFTHNLLGRRFTAQAPNRRWVADTPTQDRNTHRSRSLPTCWPPASMPRSAASATRLTTPSWSRPSACTRPN